MEEKLVAGSGIWEPYQRREISAQILANDLRFVELL